MSHAARNPVTGVTPQQERFAVEYVKTGRPSVAYRRAYEASGMDSATIHKRAWELTQDGAIAGRIEHFRQRALARLEASVERIALELARVAFFDPRDLFDEDGRPIPIADLPEDAARVIAGIDVEDLFARIEGDRGQVGVVKKYKLSNKLAALETLAKWRKMLVDRVETGKPGEFEHIDKDELEARIKERSVRLGLAKIVPITKAA